jgi:four helix bundle protein
MTRGLGERVAFADMKRSGVDHHRHLIVWQVAMSLVAECYRIARSLPTYERFGLASQLRRASVSVVSNIAEGNGRGSRAEYVHFLSIAHGSLMEVTTLLDVARLVEYAADHDLSAARREASRVGSLLNRLMRALREGPTRIGKRAWDRIPGPGSRSAERTPSLPGREHSTPARSVPRDLARSR